MCQFVCLHLQTVSHSKCMGSCTAGEQSHVLGPWDLKGVTSSSTYLQSFSAIIGNTKCVIILSAFNLFWRGHYTALVYVWNKILIYKRNMADTFYYKSLSPVNWKDGLMLTNVITLISSKFCYSKNNSTALANPPTLLSILHFHYMRN